MQLPTKQIFILVTQVVMHNYFFQVLAHISSISYVHYPQWANIYVIDMGKPGDKFTEKNTPHLNTIKTYNDEST